MHLLSPYTNISDYARNVTPSGKVVDNLNYDSVYIDSYGSISSISTLTMSRFPTEHSPGTNMSSCTFHSDPIGDVWYDSAGAGGVTSYGNLIR